MDGAVGEALFVIWYCPLTLLQRAKSSNRSCGKSERATSYRMAGRIFLQSSATTMAAADQHICSMPDRVSSGYIPWVNGWFRWFSDALTSSNNCSSVSESTPTVFSLERISGTRPHWIYKIGSHSPSWNERLAESVPAVAKGGNRWLREKCHSPMIKVLKKLLFLQIFEQLRGRHKSSI